MKRKLVLLPSLLLFLSFSCGGGLGEGLGGEDDDGPVHFQGKSCGSCHDFSGGTVFTNLYAPDNDAGSAASGYKVKLLFPDGTAYVSSYGRGTGNFIIPKGNLKNWFRAVVIDANGREVNSSMKNSYSHNPNRFECNACHTQNGANGAPGRIVNYDYYGGGK